MKKPVFFISSTIFDFKDLRSSIKWWLEENNYIVNASEFNDFDKPLDENSYEACLRSIDNSDYFVLLIGDRIGGMYDKETTITQMEYKYAYQRMVAGKLKMINFVRQDTWTNFLDSKEKIKQLKADVSIAKSITENLFREDEKIRFAFIDEVRRVGEMKAGERPKGNWLHRFNVFSDVVFVFRIELGNNFDLNFKQNRFIILGDIKANLRTICSKDEGRIYPIGFMSSELWNNFQLDVDQFQITIPKINYVNYASFYISCLQIKPFRTNRIDSFYKAGFFLGYDKNQHDFIDSDLSTMALNLLNTYERLNSLHTSMYDGQNNKLISLGMKADNSHLNVTPIEILLALEFYDDLRNCINLSKNLYRALQGLSYSVPVLIRHKRIPEKMRPKEDELITEDDILKFLNWDDPKPTTKR
jgi:hypothetical protein